jgi:hypothetical protein
VYSIGSLYEKENYRQCVKYFHKVIAYLLPLCIIAVWQDSLLTPVITFPSLLSPDSLRRWLEKENKMAKTNTNVPASRIDLEDFLDSLNLPNKATIHVNGREHPTAVVVVDFGAPLQQVRLTSAQNIDLGGRIRRYTKDVLNKDIYIRIASDNYAGVVYWSTVAPA